MTKHTTDGTFSVPPTGMVKPEVSGTGGGPTMTCNGCGMTMQHAPGCSVVSATLDPRCTHGQPVYLRCVKCEDAHEVNVASNGLTPDAACKLIEDALRSYRCTYTRDGDEHCESGTALVDMLTPPDEPTIKRGDEELVLLAEHLFDELPPFGTPPLLSGAHEAEPRWRWPSQPAVSGQKMRRLLEGLAYFGRIHTVTGVLWFGQSHEDAIKQVESMLAAAPSPPATCGNVAYTQREGAE